MCLNLTPRTNDKLPSSQTGLVLEHAFWMKKEGYKESTIERRSRILRVIVQRADLSDPESVKIAIAGMNWSEGTKELACDSYLLFAKSRRFSFEKNRYERG